MALSLFPYRDYDEIRVFDDTLDDLETLRKIVALRSLDDPWHLLDCGDIVRRHRTWILGLPKVVPHYAVRITTSPSTIRHLASLGASFDCSSKSEANLVLDCGVSADRIICASPIKTPLSIRWARSAGITKLTADNTWELRKIKDNFPDAKILIRFRCDSIFTHDYLGRRYGCDPYDDAVRCLRACKDLGLEVHGLSFHVGSPVGEVAALSRGIGICKYLIDKAQSLGIYTIRLIDVGGDIPAERELIFDDVWDHFTQLHRPFVLKGLLFDYRHLIFWLNDYYRTNWRYVPKTTTTTTSTNTTNASRSSSYKRVTYKSTLSLPWTETLRR